MRSADEGMERGKIRVLFLSDHLGHTGGIIHGATRYFLTALPELAAHDIDLTVAFLRGDHPSSQMLKEAGITPTFFDRAKQNPLTVLDVFRLIRRKRIQVIHAAGMKGILTARFAGRIAGVPVIAHLHDQMPVPSTCAKLLRKTPNLSMHTLAVSSDVASFAQTELNIDPRQIEVLPNGLDIDSIAQTPPESGQSFRRKHGVPEDAKVIGILGRLVPVKGHDTLLRAMPGVLAHEPSARLLIVGDGPDRAALEQRAHELGLTGYVFFTGHVTDAYAALSATDVLAMPSTSEGLPYALLEALAMRKPIVASAVGGMAETLTHGVNGILVRPDDAMGLTQALACVLTDSDLRNAITQCGFETVQRFGVEKHVERLYTIYHAVAHRLPVPTSEPVVTDHADAPSGDPVAAFALAMRQADTQPQPLADLSEPDPADDDSHTVEHAAVGQSPGMDDKA